jgi:hypothetical protein
MRDVPRNDNEDADDDADCRADDDQPQLFDCAQLRLEERDISSPRPNPDAPLRLPPMIGPVK